MSDDQQKNGSPEYTPGGKRPFVSTYDNRARIFVATAPVSGQCTLCYTNGSPFRNNAGIDVDELEAC
ncbi:hypothetical protein DER44DRAFT_807369 [Fusarium oxysporum]|nr:hypothetical protein DER44DRAFT_807369 [Fusarium oxysporum]